MSKRPSKTRNYQAISLLQYRIIGLFATVLALVIYSQTAQFGRAIDDHLIYDQMREISDGISGFAEILRTRYNISEYRPVTLFSFQLERMVLGKLSLGVGHVVNMILYICSLWVILDIARHLLKEIGSSGRKSAGGWFFAAAVVGIFAAHPIHANVVANLKNRDGLLSMLFVLLAVRWLFLNLDKKWNASHLLVFAAFYLLAFFSKRDAVGLLIVAPVAVLLFRPGRRKLAFSLLLICLAVQVSFTVARSTLAPIPMSVDVTDTILFSENPMGSGIVERLSALVSTVWLYMKSFIVPTGYYYYFGYDVFTFPFRGILLAAAATGTACLLALTLLMVKRDRVLVFGLVFMGANLLYCLNFISPVAGIYAPRLAYISSFGFCIILTALMTRIPSAPIRVALVAVIIFLLGVLSHDRTGDWRSFEELVSSDVPHLESSHEANRIAGEVYAHIADTISENGMRPVYFEKALVHLSRANNIFSESARAQFYEGYVRYSLGQVKPAIACLERSDALDLQINESTTEMLGDAYYYDGNIRGAVNAYTRVWNNNSDKQYLIYKIFNTYRYHGDSTAAKNYVDSLIAVNPDVYPPYEIKGNFYLYHRDTFMAVRAYQNALVRGLKNEHVENFVLENLDKVEGK